MSDADTDHETKALLRKRNVTKSSDASAAAAVADVDDQVTQQSLGVIFKKAPLLGADVEASYNKIILEQPWCVFQHSSGYRVIVIDEFGRNLTKHQIELATIPVIANLDAPTQNAWFRLVFLFYILYMALSVSLVYLSNQYTIAAYIIERYPMTYILIVLLSFGMIAFWYSRIFDELSYLHQIFGFTLTSIVMTIIACGLTTYYVSIDVLLNTLYIIISVMLFFLFCSMQSRFKAFNRAFLTLCSLIMIGVIAFFALYWPFREFWHDPLEHWSQRPSVLMDNVWSIVSSAVIITALVWNMNRLVHELRYHQYIYASFKLYIDSMLIVLTTMRASMNFRSQTLRSEVVESGNNNGNSSLGGSIQTFSRIQSFFRRL